MAFPSKQTVQSVARRGQQAAALLRKEKKEPSLTPAVRTAIEAMVFEGRKRAEAAEVAGLKDDSLRKALTKPDALAFLNECMEVLRTSARPRALHKMVDLLDAKTERIQFESAKYLDGMDRPSHAVGATQVNVQVNNTVNVTPGYVIRLGRTAPQIEHLEAHGRNALPDQADVPEED
jgi:hypothetical protein